MANILKRFTDIMSANINALLDKVEDPAKMVDQYIRDIESDLGNVKAETAAVMAAEKKAKRDLDENTQEMEKMTRYAEKACGREMKMTPAYSGKEDGAGCQPPVPGADLCHGSEQFRSHAQNA